MSISDADLHRRLPPLNAVRAFEAAARHQSFKAAGEELGVTPGAVSRQIVVLEASLGTRLFERLHRRVELTASGRLFLAETSPALGRIAMAADAVRAGGNERVLRLKLPPTFAIRWFVPRLARFHALHPDLSVQVTTSHDPADFGREPIDAGIFWGASLPRGSAGLKLFDERLVPVCSPAMLDRLVERDGSMRPERLARQVLLHSFRRPDDWRRWLAAAGLSGRRLDRPLVFENSSLTYQGAVDGLGVAIAQTAFVRDDLAAGRLAVASPIVVETGMGYFLNYPRQSAGLPRIKALDRWLLSESRRD